MPSRPDRRAEGARARGGRSWRWPRHAGLERDDPRGIRARPAAMRSRWRRSCGWSAPRRGERARATPRGGPAAAKPTDAQGPPAWKSWSAKPPL